MTQVETLAKYAARASFAELSGESWGRVLVGFSTSGGIKMRLTVSSECSRAGQVEFQTMCRFESQSSAEEFLAGRPGPSLLPTRHPTPALPD